MARPKREEVKAPEQQIEASGKLAAIRLAMDQIEKQYGKGSIMKLGEQADGRFKVDTIPTGSIALDLALGVGGLPRGRIVEIYGPEASGKCVSEDTLIFSAEGVIPISSFGNPKIPEFQEKEVFVYSENCFEKTSHFYNGGKKRTLKVSTNCGFQIEGTPNHRIRVINENGDYLFRRLDQLRMSDMVAIQRGQDCFGRGVNLNNFIYKKHYLNSSKKDFSIHSIDTELARLMGYLIGDGTITNTGLNKNQIQMTVSEEEIARDLENICQKIFEERPKVTYDRRTRNVRRFVIHNVKARTFLAYAGLGYWSAKEKEIPYSILQSPKEIVANFISALFTTDGSFSGSTVEYCTKSQKLARQLQILLLNFGIVTRLRLKYVSGYPDSYFYLDISGQVDKEKFAREIGFTLTRKQNALLAHLERTNLTHTNIDVIPNINTKLHQFLNSYRLQIRETNRKDWDIFYDYLPQTPGYSQLSYPRMNKILEYYFDGQPLPEYQYLEQLVQLGFFWDGVKNIDPAENYVYDFTVPSNATFFGNGFVNHNTTLALHVIAEAQKKGGQCAFIDAEHALDPERAEAIGVNLDDLLMSQPDTGEQALEMGDAVMGLQARLMSQALRKLTGAISKSKTILIFTNQMRQKIGVMFGNPETTPGGLALKFYSSIRIDVRRIEVLKEGDLVIGSRHRARIVKNKVAPPLRVAEFDIMNDEGISKCGGLLDVAVDLALIDKKGSFFNYNGKPLAQGREGAKMALKEDKKLAEEIEKRIREAVAAGKKVPKEIGEEKEE